MERPVRRGRARVRPRYRGAGDPAGATVLDVGCGAGRALPLLATAAGSRGCAIGIDLTAEMLHAARAEGGAAPRLVLGDAARLPIRSRSCDVVFAAGLLAHLPDPLAGLVELARVARPGAMLGLFHPVGRATLADKARSRGSPR